VSTYSERVAAYLQRCNPSLFHFPGLGFSLLEGWMAEIPDRQWFSEHDFEGRGLVIGIRQGDCVCKLLISRAEVHVSRHPQEYVASKVRGLIDLMRQECPA